MTDSSNSSNSCALQDPVEVLPFDTVSKIFLLLDLHDIFGRCTLVSKRWNGFITGHLFWHDLILSEFGDQIGSEFIKANNGDATSLRQMLLKDCFRPNGVKTIHKYPDMIDGLFGIVPTIEDFIEKIAANRNKLDDEPFIYQYGCNSNKFLVMNIPVVIQSPADSVHQIGLELYARFFAPDFVQFYRFVCLDKEFQQVSEYDFQYSGLQDENVDIGYSVTVRCHPKTCFIVVEMDYVTHIWNFRFLLPRHAQLFFKFVETIDTLEWYSPNWAYPLVDSLLKAHPTVVNWSRVGYTLLMRACTSIAIMRRILNAGADVHQIYVDYRSFDARNCEDTVLELAISHEARQKLPVGYSCYEIVKFLLDNGANPNSRTLTYSLIYKEKPNFEIAKLLLDRGVDVNEQNERNDWRTVLMDAVDWCCHSGRDSLNNKNIVEFLLQHGADANLANNKGETAFDFSLQNAAIRQIICGHLQHKTSQCNCPMT